VDKIAAAGASPIWWQLYPQEDMDHTKDLLDHALAAGAKAIVMTVDQQASYYERSLRDRNLNAAPLGGGGRPGGGRARCRGKQSLSGSAIAPLVQLAIRRSSTQNAERPASGQGSADG
jgi:hypothetical protein